MSDLQKYISKRKKANEDFAKEEGFKNFKIGETFAERAKKGDWEKAREVLAKSPDTKADDYDKL